MLLLQSSMTAGDEDEDEDAADDADTKAHNWHCCNTSSPSTAAPR